MIDIESTPAPGSVMTVPEDTDRTTTGAVDARCNQTYELTLVDRYRMIVRAHHGYLDSWTLLGPRGQAPATGPVEGEFDGGHVDVVSLAELAGALRGQELADPGPSSSRSVLAEWPQAHSWETDEDDYSYLETPSGRALDLQDDIIRTAGRSLFDCQDALLLLRPALFEEMESQFRVHEHGILLPSAHVEVVKRQDLEAFVHEDAWGDQAVVSFPMTSTEWDIVRNELAAGIFDGQRLYLALAF